MGKLCSDTKHKIAQTLHQMMLERPLNKITVQNLMERTQMKRQSFYYHFQDIRDVLRWLCDRQLTRPLMSCDLDFEDWLVYGLQLLEQDRLFYRRTFEGTDRASLYEFARLILCPRIGKLLYGTGQTDRLDQRQQFVVDFCVRATWSYVEEFACTRRPMDERMVRERVRALLSMLRLTE